MSISLTSLSTISSLIAITRLMDKNQRMKRKSRIVIVKTRGGKIPGNKARKRYGEKEDVVKRDEVVKQRKLVRYKIIYLPNEEEAPIMKVSKKSSEDFDCNICWRNVSTGYIVITPCSHQFCETCLKQWFTTQLRQHLECTCPMCREKRVEAAKLLGVIVDLEEDEED